MIAMYVRHALTAATKVLSVATVLDVCDGFAQFMLV
jgi:hypothetical protein